MNDLISRQAAIDALMDALTDVGALDAEDINTVFQMLPSAQPDHNADVSEMVKQTAETEQNVPNDDLISRKAAIEAINTWDKFGVDERGRLVRWQEGLVLYVRLRDVLIAIVNLPSAQPEIIYCEQCKYYVDYRCRKVSTLADWRRMKDFCSYAERRDGDG